MRVAVLGAGAIGAYVGAALHRGGTEVHLVARGPHLEAIRKNGVRVLSPRGDWAGGGRPATDDPAEIGPVDFVFLGLKANSYASCGPLIEPLLHDKDGRGGRAERYPMVVLPRAGPVRTKADGSSRVDPGGEVTPGPAARTRDRLRRLLLDRTGGAGPGPAPRRHPVLDR